MGVFLTIVKLGVCDPFRREPTAELDVYMHVWRITTLG